MGNYGNNAKYDVIVIGAGTAGIPCAITAAEKGLKVLLIEKESEVGGTLHISGGHMSAAGARRQIEKGFVDSVELHRADIERLSGGASRNDLVNLATGLAAKTIDWLDDNGFEFAPETPRLVYGHEPYSVARTYYGIDQGKSILKILARLLDNAIHAYALELKLNISVSEILTNDSGSAIGVKTDDGNSIFASKIVLATGGFGANPELFRKLEKAKLVSASWPTSTGDGLLMAEAIGAKIVGEGTYLPTFGGLPPPDDSGKVRWTDRPLLIANERPPYEIYVDRKGNRWVAEDEESIDKKEHALSGIEDMTFWTIFDSVGLEKSQPMVVGWSPEKFQEQANRLRGVFSAQTLEVLALKAGIDPENLAKTVAVYNQDLEMNAPDKFGRSFRPAPIIKAPFYSLQNHAVTLITFSGVDVSSDLEVRNSNGEIIPNLYAIGELLGAAAMMGKSFAGGMLVMPALALGRWLGEELALSSGKQHRR
jgi:predicted flavoprotein YhiN